MHHRALNSAISRRDVEEVRRLIRSGVPVNVGGPVLDRPLWNAVMRGTADIVPLLLEAGADPNMPPDKDDPPNIALIQIAAARGDESITFELLRAGATWNESPLVLAARFGKLNAIELLFRHIPDLDVDAKGSEGTTALHEACFHKHPDVIRFLIRRGANINARTSDGMTPIKIAVGNQHIDLAFFEASPDMIRRAIVDLREWKDPFHDMLLFAKWGPCVPHAFRGASRYHNLTHIGEDRDMAIRLLLRQLVWASDVRPSELEEFVTTRRDRASLIATFLGRFLLRPMVDDELQDRRARLYRVSMLRYVPSHVARHILGWCGVM